MPVVYRKLRNWTNWVVAGSILLWVISLWATQVEGKDFFPSLNIFILPLLWFFWTTEPWFVLVDRVLVLWNGQRVSRVPLARAEIKELKKGWQVRWPEGRIGRRLTFDTTPEFYQAVVQAATEAMPADPGTVPQSEREAARVVVLARLPFSWAVQMALPAGVLVLALLADQLDHALVLLPLVAAPFVAARIIWGHGIALLGSQQIWVLNRRGVLHGIPFPALREIQETRRNGVLLRTDDPVYPILRLRAPLGEEPLGQILRLRAAGEPVLPPRPEARPADPGRPEGPMRCSLCGRPEPGTVAGTGIFVCERCGGRTRHEANESGHGLSPREPKPM